MSSYKSINHASIIHYIKNNRAKGLSQKTIKAKLLKEIQDIEIVFNI